MSAASCSCIGDGARVFCAILARSPSRPADPFSCKPKLYGSGLCGHWLRAIRDPSVAQICTSLSESHRAHRSAAIISNDHGCCKTIAGPVWDFEDCCLVLASSVTELGAGAAAWVEQQGFIPFCKSCPCGALRSLAPDVRPTRRGQARGKASNTRAGRVLECAADELLRAEPAGGCQPAFAVALSAALEDLGGRRCCRAGATCAHSLSDAGRHTCTACLTAAEPTVEPEFENQLCFRWCPCTSGVGLCGPSFRTAVKVPLPLA